MRKFLLLFLFISSFVSAQVTDNFSDGDFTASPVWSGDGAEFIINGTQQLQLNNTIAGASYLSTASPTSSLNNIEWRFYIKQTFAPSGSNYGRVYLASDQANLEGSLNGYYLQFGEAGTLDAVELFRQSGLTSTSIARGTNGQVAASFSIGIKVTRDASGNWNLYVDPAGGTTYGLQATGTDNTFITTAYFGVAAVYTASNATKFFFDDFYNGAIVVDTTPPSIVSSTVISNSQLDVLFSEDIDLTTSQTVTNYSADNGLGNPSSAVRDASSFNLVHLTFAATFSSALLNTLTVTNVQDLNANAITSATTTFTYFAPVVPAYRDIIINEIFADPSPQVALPLFEFIEIYNRGITTFNLNGWKFSDGTSTGTLSNFNLAPGQYLILCPIADTSVFIPYGNTMGLTTFPSLNNTGDNLKFRDNSLVLIDSVNYSDTWYQDVVKKNGGWTLELINPNAPAGCPTSSNWIASVNVDGGTPGIQNSVYSAAADVTSPTISGISITDPTHITVCFSEAIDASQVAVLTNYSIDNGIGAPLSAIANGTLTCVDLVLGTALTGSVTYMLTASNISDCSGNALSPATSNFTYVVPAVPSYKDIIINEIFADPAPQVALPLFEFVELYNRGTNTFNLNGWKFTDGTSTGTLGNYNLAPGQYLILCPAADTSLFIPYGTTMGLTTFPSLNNTGDNLKLNDNALVLIDSVNYSDTWYQDAVKKNGGWTLELINPNGPAGCPASSNWIASVNADGGTPGIQNSVYSTVPDVTAPTITGVSIVDSTHITLCFSEAVDASQIATLANYNINNSIGTPIAAIANSGLTCVDLVLGTPLTGSVTYTLTASNISDCSGNALSPVTANFTYVVPAVPAYKDIIINEIFADPTPQVGLPLFEFVEIYNRGTNTFNLNGWKFTDGSSTGTLSNFNIAPGQYLILCPAADTALYNPYGATMGLTTFPSLNNTGDNLKLSDNTIVVIDSVNFSDTWYQDAAKKNGGWTLELINPNAPAGCPASSNWIASVYFDGGTPGVMNSVHSTAPDVTAPSISGVTIIDSTHIRVCFSEAVDASQIGILGNYNINNAIGIPDSAISNSTLTCVDLVLGTPLTAAVTYTLTISNMSDCSGNALIPVTSTFTYVIPAIASYKDILINEIFADPSPQVALPAFEFVEIYNKGTNTFNLNGWKFTDGSSTATLSNYSLAPNSYLIICPVADTALYSVYGNVMGVGSFPSLNNTGDHLYLKNDVLTLIDSVNYSDTWFRDDIKKDGGWTLELINPNAPAGCPPSSNWIASINANGGSPGIQNSVYSTAPDVTSPTIAAVSVIDSTHISVCFSEAIDVSQLSVPANYSINNGIGVPSAAAANGTFTCVDLTLTNALISSTSYIITLSSMSDCSGNNLTPVTASFDYYKVKPFDVVINEIMAAPDNSVGLSSIQYEYVELYNRTGYTVNLNNWEYTAGTNTKTLPNINIAPNGFVVLTTTTNAPLFPATANAMGVVSFPSLTNTGQSLTLRTPDGNVISSVSYSDAWYQDAAKINGGWSLEQMDPNNPCAGMSNWRASVSADGGTPGRQNSVYSSNPDNTPPQVVRVSLITNDSILVYFNEPLDSTTMLNPSIYSIDNSIGMPLQVMPLGPDFKSVSLTLGASVLPGIIYTLTVNNAITDCVGNPIGTDNSARFAIPDSASANDIVINEILTDPNTGGVDFVEIYNRSVKVIDLKTLMISNYDTINNIPVNSEIISNDGYLIFPGDYLVLSENGNAVKSQYNTTDPEAFLDIPNLPTMSIASGTICIAAGANVIDHFTYYDNMQFPLLNVTKGVSLERINYDRPTQDRTNWHSASEAVGYGTPGYKNSQYSDAGETDNAIEVTPEVFSPDEDGVNDIVNINYHFDTPGYVANVTIYDSKGRLIKYLVRNELLGTKGTFSWDGINEEREKARIGIYIIFTEVFDLSGKVKHYKKTCVLAGKID